MTGERERYIRNLDSLAVLSDHTDVIGVTELGKVEIQYKIPAPTDEYGIPRPEIMVQQLLGRMATANYVWTGRFDEHHLATPKADFTIVRTEAEGNIGSAFRGLSCLKIDLARQMHNFSHALFELPGRPSVEVMRQAVTEVGYAKKLQQVMNQYFPEFVDEQSERTSRIGRLAIADALSEMEEPQVGMLPTLELLASLELEELRRVLSTTLRIRSFNDKRLVHPAVRTVSAHKLKVSRSVGIAA